MISDPFLYILIKVEQHISHLNFTSVDEDLTIVKVWTQSLETREDVLWLDSCVVTDEGFSGWMVCVRACVRVCACAWSHNIMKSV